MCYRLQFDSKLAHQWFLDTPVNASGDEWAFWKLLRGTKVDGTDLKPWSSKVKQPGRPLAFSFAGFDVPIVDARISDILAQSAKDDVQLVSVEIPGHPPGYHLLVATKNVECVDEQNSDFMKWTRRDGRPEKVGSYRMFTKLRLASSMIPPELGMFRLCGWNQALIVSEAMARLLQRNIQEGLCCEPVT